MFPVFRFQSLTARNYLILLHDALVTAAAVLASFISASSGGFAERLPILLRILPYFVLLSIVVCYWLRLTTTKWRFISIPDLFNILRVSTILAIALLVIDYILIAPNVYGDFFFGKTTIIIYWFLPDFSSADPVSPIAIFISPGPVTRRVTPALRRPCCSAGRLTPKY